MKNTKCKESILNVLKYSDKPITAKQIFINCSDLDLSTVYRCLARLEKEEIITKETRFDKKSYYRLNTNSKHVHHMICDNCKDVTEIECTPVENIITNISMKENFEVKNHFFEVHGICKKCK